MGNKMDFIRMSDDQERALEHEEDEQSKAWTYLQELGDVMLAEVTVSDVGILLDIDVYTHGNRMRVKRLYEEYVKSTDWTPQRHPS